MFPQRTVNAWKTAAEFIRTHRDAQFIIALFLLAFLTRFPFVSSSADAWDAAVYIRRAETFALTGYFSWGVNALMAKPGFIFLIAAPTYLIYTITGSIVTERVAVYISALLGSLSIIPFYYLVKIVSGRREAVTAALFLIFSPLHWFYSEIVMSDMSSLFFVLSSLTLAYMWAYSETRNIKLLIFAGLTLGYAMTIRFVDFLAIPALLTIILQALFKRKARRKLLPVILIPVFICLAIFALLSYQPVFQLPVTTWIASIWYRLWHPTIVGLALEQLIGGLTIPIFAFAALGFYAYVDRTRRRVMLPLIVWIAPYLWLFLALNWTSWRYFLPIYPPLITLAAISIWRIVPKTPVKLVFMGESKKINLLPLVIIIFLLFFGIYSTAPTVYAYHSRVHFSKAIALWYHDNTPPNTVILARQELPYVEYYGQRKAYHLGGFWERASPQMLEFFNKSLRVKVSTGIPVYVSSWALEDVRNADPALYDQISKNFELQEVGDISAENLRNISCPEPGSYKILDWEKVVRTHPIKIYRLYLPTT